MVNGDDRVSTLFRGLPAKALMRSQKFMAQSRTSCAFMDEALFGLSMHSTEH